MLDHFNLLAPIYEKVIKPKEPAQLAGLLELEPGNTLLDVGGGTGRITQFFVETCGQVVLADTSFNMLQKSQSKIGMDQVNGASEFLPFESETMDRVLMVDALHHVYDQKVSARELWRVLKPAVFIIAWFLILNWGKRLR